MSDDLTPEVGDIVETETGYVYPAVGREQGGRTLLLPCGPGGSTREFFRDNLEVVKKDASVEQAYRLGLKNAPVDEEVADTVASLAIEEFIPKDRLPGLHNVLGPETGSMVMDKMGGGDE